MNWILNVVPEDTLSRIAVPEKWDSMRRKMMILDEYKINLIKEFPKLQDKEIEYALFVADNRSEDGSYNRYVYLSAYCEGLAYRNAGMGWSLVGGAEIDKIINGNRLHFVE